jgi:hypothetical protein
MGSKGITAKSKVFAPRKNEGQVADDAPDEEFGAMYYYCTQSDRLSTSRMRENKLAKGTKKKFTTNY